MSSFPSLYLSKLQESRNDPFSSLPLFIPGNELIKSLSTVLTPFLDKMSANTSESQSLTKLRDTLLPKLISGELRVSEAEQLTEEAL